MPIVKVAFLLYICSMIYILFILIVCVGGGFLIGKGASSLIPDDGDYSYSPKTKESPTIIHNYNTITENHLHISKEDLKQLVEEKKNA